MSFNVPFTIYNLQSTVFFFFCNLQGIVFSLLTVLCKLQRLESPNEIFNNEEEKSFADKIYPDKTLKLGS